MVQVNKRIGTASPVPGIAPDMYGAPVTVPGGNDGTDKAGMTGTPAGSATLPPSFTSEVSGAPEAGQTVNSPAPEKITSAEPDVNEKQKKEAVAGYDDIISTLEKKAAEYAPETPEQREKRERREKSARIISAVSDGLSALSNLYFTTQYAPNMYSHEKGSQLTPLQSRLEKAKSERESNADKYLQFALRLGDTKNERAKTLRELEAQQERQRLAREKAQREAEAHGWAAVLQPDKQREQAGKANRAEQEAITAQAEAEAAPELQQAKIATEKARKGSLDASAANSRASAAAHGRSNQNEFSAWDEHGNEHKFRTKEAAEAYAKQHGTWKEEDVVETTESENEINGKTSSTKTKKGGHAGKPSPTGRQSPTA